MKKFLLFVLLAFSANAIFAYQLLPGTARKPVKSPLEIVKSFPKKSTWKTPGVLTTEKINEYIKAQQALAIQYELLDSVRYWNWDVNTKGWVNDHKTIKITYDNKDRIISSIEQEWNNDTQEWENTSKSPYTYNSSDLMTMLSIETWDGSNWTNGMKTTITYDENKNSTTTKL